MMKRKYTNIRILLDVYCNSMSQYSFTARCRDDKRHYNLDYSPGFGLICWHKRGWPMSIRFPKYVEREIERLICEAYHANRLTVHEYDQEGNERRKDYRYHSPELLQSEIERMMKP